MTIFTDFANIHWNASAAAGMLTDCVPRGKAAVKVKFDEPDVVDMLTGMQSKEYVIEYRQVDMPYLVEGFGLSMTERDGTIAKYTVRKPPFVDLGQGMDGTYRRAILTRDRARDS